MRYNIVITFRDKSVVDFTASIIEGLSAPIPRENIGSVIEELFEDQIGANYGGTIEKIEITLAKFKGS